MKSKYDKIINPKTGRLVNVNGNLGKNIINRYLLELNGGRRKLIPRVYTKKSQRANYKKAAPSIKDLEYVTSDAERYLKTDGKVVFSMVWPDGAFKHEEKTHIHQGHTFAMSRNKDTLVVYDNSHDKKYYNRDENNEKIWDPKVVKNYQNVINKLKGNRNLVFFTLVTGIDKYDKILDLGQGSCMQYIEQLIKDNLIQDLPLKNMKIKGDNGDTWLYNASKNEINKIEATV